MIASLQFMWGNAAPEILAARFARLVEQLGGDMAAVKAMSQQRELLSAVDKAAPATLNQIAAAVERGAPAVSRAIDGLVRGGLVERQADPGNRRRLALRLTPAGENILKRPPAADQKLEGRLARLAASELRAIERGFDILERLPK
jgi:DNA-binding MarR family transcriptional regulator